MIRIAGFTSRIIFTGEWNTGLEPNIDYIDDSSEIALSVFANFDGVNTVPWSSQWGTTVSFRKDMILPALSDFFPPSDSLSLEAYCSSISIGDSTLVAYADYNRGKQIRVDCLFGTDILDPAGEVTDDSNNIVTFFPGDFPSLAAGPDAIPVVAFQDWIKNGKITVKRYNISKKRWDDLGYPDSSGWAPSLCGCNRQ